MSRIDQAGRLLSLNAERHLKSPQEMARLFARYPDALAQTQVLLARCHFSLDEMQHDYPHEAAGLRHAAAAADRAGRRRHDTALPERRPAPKVRRALDHELQVIGELGYAPFFLTVHDIVRFARTRPKPILCQGRGSAANSIICYCLGITDVSPDTVDLLFERFVSAERREPPDIDVDFEHERREEVIQYIYAEIWPRACRPRRHRDLLSRPQRGARGRQGVRAVGGHRRRRWPRRCGAGRWTAYREKEARRAGLDPSDPRLQMALALTQELQGFPRHLSQHVGGFVITRTRLDEVVPIENAAMEDRTVIEWDKDDLDALGLLKVDVLGLGMLTCLRRAFDFLRAHYDVARDLSMQDEDQPTYRMIQRADTIGVFQIESRAQMSMLPRLKPEKFYDLVIEVAIVRPGPIQGNMVHPYLQRREAPHTVTYPSPAPPWPADELEQVLGKTLGVPLFQEQAMRIAIVAAGFTPAEADRLRRAMATFQRVGTIGTFQRQDDRGHGGERLRARFRRALLRADQGLRRIRLSGKPCGELRHSGLRLVLAEMPLPGRVRGRAAQQPADGLLRTGADRARRAGARRRGARRRYQCIATGTARWRRRRIARGQARSHPRHASHARTTSSTTHALRLGLRQVSGLSEDDGRIDRGDARRRLRFHPRSVAAHRLAPVRAGDARAMPMPSARSGCRAAMRSGPSARCIAPATRTTCRCSRASSMPEMEPDVALPPMLPGEQVVEDYRHLKLSLHAHPVSFLRADLDAPRHPAQRDARRARHPAAASRIAGIVLIRQRPGTAKGVIFMTLEDETGIANTIVWPKVFETFRPVVLGARLVGVTGKLQNEKGVIHVVADQIEDLTPLLRRLSEHGPSIESLARCDEVKRPDPGNRSAQEPGQGRASAPRRCAGAPAARAARTGRGPDRDPQGDAEGPEFSLMRRTEIYPLIPAKARIQRKRLGPRLRGDERQIKRRRFDTTPPAAASNAPVPNGSIRGFWATSSTSGISPSTGPIATRPASSSTAASSSFSIPRAGTCSRPRSASSRRRWPRPSKSSACRWSMRAPNSWCRRNSATWSRCIPIVGEFRRSSFEVRHQIYVDGQLAVDGSETRVWASLDENGQLKTKPIPADVIAKFKTP